VVNEIGPIREVASKDVMTILKTDREEYWNFNSLGDATRKTVAKESMTGKKESRPH
jgi:hypothetical protein